MQFVKQWGKGQKKFIKRAEIKSVDVPRYRELSVDSIYKLVKDDAEVMSFLPDKKDPPHKQPPREFVLCVVNTVAPGFVERLL
jgi:hypothetical protein